MTEEIKTHVTCGHCKGTGTCKNVTNKDGSIQSCYTCIFEDLGYDSCDCIIVKCSICKGTGWVKLK